ncbi:hypothetical protein [Geofilum rhodophaeum]|uniref:hypothetical protein n=1 Tax=Geofilum rhodophaeum TaxID=1965019 RepID=UPI000B5235FB|nr:hypothetical protein [Geofilum rhodophaeum]
METKIKRLLILGFSLLIPFLTFSQTDSISKSPTAKDFMIEINFNPFGDDGIFSFENLQTKYWINNKTALRLGLQFDYNNNSTTEDDYKSDEVYKPTVSEKSFLLGFKPGIEFRILPNSRISPYWGFEFSYINKSSSSEYVEYDREYDYDIQDYVYNKVETNVDGAWREIETGYYNFNNGYYYYSNTSYGKERAYSSYGLNLLLGTDVFVYKNLYMGFEIGIGYELIKYKQIKLEINDSGETDPVEIEENNSTYPSSKTSDFGFYYNNSIRLGVYF